MVETATDMSKKEADIREAIAILWKWSEESGLVETTDFSDVDWDESDEMTAAYYFLKKNK